MGHRPKTSMVETLKHEEAYDPQPHLFADVHGLAYDEAAREFNQTDASCAKWLYGSMLSREVSR
jgi:hypothetical protein